ncbi:hypothetical protein [Streptomyces sp. NBC_00055]|uniref:hypothetical protein n=1 Tax=Streptomyces sp. NBC_00055 TaxID=2975632 RepID=UPI00325005C0
MAVAIRADSSINTMLPVRPQFRWLTLKIAEGPKNPVFLIAYEAFGPMAEVLHTDPGITRTPWE